MISIELFKEVMELEVAYIVPEDQVRWNTLTRKNDIVYEKMGDTQYNQHLRIIRRV